MDILVINLMRLGDLIQSSPVLRGLRTAYPRARVTLLALDIFKEPAFLLAGVDRLLLFPSLMLAGALDDKGGWPEAFRQLRAWFEAHLSPPPDLVINLTPNLMGAILTRATGGREMRGLTVDLRQQVYTVPSWASYALVASKARIANPFNIVDLFVREAGLKPDGAGLQVEIPPETQAEADSAIKDLGLAPGTALVGLFPGASTPARQWPPDSFAQAASLLRAARPCHFVIFGSSQEEPLGEAIRSQLPAEEVTLCQGRTSLAGLAAYLKRLDLLLTNDTGPMHLAAAVGIPVAALFLATARVLDTGPTGRGHLAIEPDLDCHPCLEPCAQPRCHAALSPEAVADLMLRLLAKRGEIREAASHGWQGVRVYLAEVDPLGGQVYLPLGRRPLTRRDFWVWAHRLAWAAILDGPDSGLETLQAWVGQLLHTHYLPPAEDLNIPGGRQVLADVQEITTQGEFTARHIWKLTGQDSTTPARLLQKMEGFERLDSQLRRLAVEFPQLASVIDFFFHDQRRPGATETAPLALELAEAYGGLGTMAATFQKILQELEAELKPGRGHEVFQEVAQEVHNQYTKTTESTSRIGVTPCW